MSGEQRIFKNEEDTSFRENHWLCRDLRMLKIKEMSDRHLYNSIGLMQRKREALPKPEEYSFSEEPHCSPARGVAYMRQLRIAVEVNNLLNVLRMEAHYRVRHEIKVSDAQDASYLPYLEECQ